MAGGIGWPAIKAGIFAGESGGDYNALYGFSNRPGGRFADVNLTGMTVDQAIQFANPKGPYAQWVKSQIGRVATPMGGFQIVGDTLKQAKKWAGLRGDEVMTPEIQDRLGQAILANQGTGAWKGYKGPRQPGSSAAPKTYQVGPGFKGQNPHYVAEPSVAPITGGLGAPPEEPQNPAAAGREMLAGLGTPMLTDEETLAMAMAMMKRQRGGQAGAAPRYEIKRTLAEAPKRAV